MHHLVVHPASEVLHEGVAAHKVARGSELRLDVVHLSARAPGGGEGGGGAGGGGRGGEGGEGGGGGRGGGGGGGGRGKGGGCGWWGGGGGGGLDVYI